MVEIAFVDHEEVAANQHSHPDSHPRESKLAARIKHNKTEPGGHKKERTHGIGLDHSEPKRLDG